MNQSSIAERKIPPGYSSSYFDIMEADGKNLE